MSWRNNLQQFIKETELTDVYEFGVFTGHSMIDIGNMLVRTGVPVRKFFGFDSFEGLPEETMEAVQQDDWNKGGFSSKNYYGVDTIKECVSVIDSHIRDHCQLNTALHLIPGFFNDTLTRWAVEQNDMGPAMYVDIDVDLYSSAIEVLRFMFANDLIRPGTIIGYDDWGGSLGWRYCLNGESRAHAEIAEEYDVKFKKLFQVGQAYPHVHVAFQVLSIGK